MNVVKILTVVLRYAQTLLALTHAVAMVDTGLTWTDMPAMVHYYNDIYTPLIHAWVFLMCRN